MVRYKYSKRQALGCLIPLLQHAKGILKNAKTAKELTSFLSTKEVLALETAVRVLRGRQ